MLPACGRGSVLLRCTSDFVDDVMFSHNVANGTEQTTLMFRRVRQVTPLGWTCCLR